MAKRRCGWLSARASLRATKILTCWAHWMQPMLKPAALMMRSAPQTKSGTWRLRWTINRSLKAQRNARLFTNAKSRFANKLSDASGRSNPSSNTRRHMFEASQVIEHRLWHPEVRHKLSHAFLHFAVFIWSDGDVSDGEGAIFFTP